MNNLYEDVYIVTMKVIGILLITIGLFKLTNILGCNKKSYKNSKKKCTKTYEEQFKNDIIKILEIIKKEKGGGDLKKELDILSELADLKMKEYNRLDDNQNDICSICLEQLNDNITLRKCNHLFHISCLKNWHKINRNCPVCRK